MLIAELLNRSRREEGYRDYFDIAVLGYHGDEVASLWKNPNRMFMRPQRFDRKRTVSRARSTGAPVARRQYRRIVGLPEDLGGALCGRQNADVSCADRVLPALQSVVRREGAPEELSADDLQHYRRGVVRRGRFQVAGDRRQYQRTLYRGRCCAADQYPHLFRCGASPVLFPESKKELPDQRYARLLYDMSSEMPAIYNESIVQLRGRDGERFRGISYNAAMTDLVSMMNIGSVSANLLF